MRDLAGLPHFKIYIEDSDELEWTNSVMKMSKVWPRVTKRRKIPRKRKNKKLLHPQKQNIWEYFFKKA
jgi:hypothetical protein